MSLHHANFHPHKHACGFYCGKRNNDDSLQVKFLELLLGWRELEPDVFFYITFQHIQRKRLYNMVCTYIIE